MSSEAVDKPRKHPVIVVLNILILVFAVLELVELLFHVGLGLLLPEAALQVVLLVLHLLAIWHAGRHL